MVSCLVFEYCGVLKEKYTVLDLANSSVVMKQYGV